MKRYINKCKLELVIGDITKQPTDAIVNAANGSLLGGGGVDGAIHRAAGKELVNECKRIREEKLNGEYLPTGEAIITKGYQLPATYVIHTVGPVWNRRLVEAKQQQLANGYKNSLDIAKKYGLNSIAFPSISTGVYHFPIDLAARTALESIVEFLMNNQMERVVMTLFSEGDYSEYVKALKRLLDE